MAKKRKHSIRERLILALGGTIKRKPPRTKGPAPENKSRGRAPENKSDLGA